jgi:hypothetical protein
MPFLMVGATEKNKLETPGHKRLTTFSLCWLRATARKLGAVLVAAEFQLGMFAS